MANVLGANVPCRPGGFLLPFGQTPKKNTRDSPYVLRLLEEWWTIRVRGRFSQIYLKIEFVLWSRFPLRPLHLKDWGGLVRLLGLKILMTWLFNPKNWAKTWVPSFLFFPTTLGATGMTFLLPRSGWIPPPWDVYKWHWVGTGHGADLRNRPARNELVVKTLTQRNFSEFLVKTFFWMIWSDWNSWISWKWHAAFKKPRPTGSSLLFSWKKGSGNAIEANSSHPSVELQSKVQPTATNSNQHQQQPTATKMAERLLQVVQTKGVDTVEAANT